MTNYEQADRAEPHPEKLSQLFVERRQEVAKLLQTSFAGAPWFEDLSNNEAMKRVEGHAMKPGFEAYLVEDQGAIVAGLWYDTPSIDELAEERGDDLANFARTVCKDMDLEQIIWQRESVVHPDYQSQGLATLLRKKFIDDIEKNSRCSSLLLTRMRDDNLGIIRVAEKFEYARTGIRMPSSQNPDADHEYWYKVIGYDQ